MWTALYLKLLSTKLDWPLKFSPDLIRPFPAPLEVEYSKLRLTWVNLRGKGHFGVNKQTYLNSKFKARFSKGSLKKNKGK